MFDLRTEKQRVDALSTEEVLQEMHEMQGMLAVYWGHPAFKDDKASFTELRSAERSLNRVYERVYVKTQIKSA